MAKILVVDDDPISREILSEILKGEGHSVVTANDGNDALARFKEAPADLVFTDIFMPGKEGFATIKELLLINPDLNIIAITGGSTFTSYDSLSLAQNYGAKVTLTKPFDRDEILTVLKSLLDGG